MGTILASTIMEQAAIKLQDTTNIRWPLTELLSHLNDAQREVVIHRPEVAASNTSVALTAGVTKQAIPSDGVALLHVVRNAGAGGTTPGRAIRVASREILDAQIPDWHTAANTLGYVQHYTYNPTDPKTFYVYPKAPDTALYVELVYSKVPATLSSSQAIGLDDIYAGALLDYVMYRAYSKDAEYALNAQLAVAYYTSFANAIGITVKNSLERNPNVIDGGMNPNVPKRS